MTTFIVTTLYSSLVLLINARNHDTHSFETPRLTTQTHGARQTTFQIRASVTTQSQTACLLFVRKDRVWEGPAWGNTYEGHLRGNFVGCGTWGAIGTSLPHLSKNVWQIGIHNNDQLTGECIDVLPTGVSSRWATSNLNINETIGWLLIHSSKDLDATT